MPRPSRSVAKLVFQEEFPNGTCCTAATSTTPATSRRAARSSSTRAGRSAWSSNVAERMRSSSDSTTPLSTCMRSVRATMTNRALQIMAQASAISKAISSAAVFCCRSAFNTGAISITGVLIRSSTAGPGQCDRPATRAANRPGGWPAQTAPRPAPTC